jgi:hypothetical protein
MLASLVLAIAQAGTTVPLTLAPDQESLFLAHANDFPKAGWVVAKDIPVSSSTQLGGRMAGVLRVGTQVEIAGVAGIVSSGMASGVMDEVVAIPLSSGEIRSAGYFPARGVAIVETGLGRTGGGAFLFATVVGRRLVTHVTGMVLDLEVWVKAGAEPPRLVISGPNIASRLTVMMTAGQVAVSLAGAVVVLASDGTERWRSPNEEVWSLAGVDGSTFAVMGPGGRVATVPTEFR